MISKELLGERITVAYTTHIYEHTCGHIRMSDLTFTFLCQKMIKYDGFPFLMFIPKTLLKPRLLNRAFVYSITPLIRAQNLDSIFEEIDLNNTLQTSSCRTILVKHKLELHIEKQIV